MCSRFFTDDGIFFFNCAHLTRQNHRGRIQFLMLVIHLYYRQITSMFLFGSTENILLNLSTFELFKRNVDF